MSYKRVLIAIDSRANPINIARKSFELTDQLNADTALIFVVDKSKANGESLGGSIKFY